MYQSLIVGIVIPAYNEEGFIGDMIRDVPAYIDRIYIIDDWSTDKTWDEITTTAQDILNSETTHAEEHINTADQPLVTDGGTVASRAFVHESIGRVLPIEHLSNRGAGGAIKTGYLATLQDETDIVATIDGDGQIDLNYLPRLLDPIVDGKANYANGATTAASGFTGMGWPTLGYLFFDQDLFIRMAISTLLFLIVSMLLMFAMLFNMQANESRELQIYE